MAKDFRFGVSVRFIRSRAALEATAKRAQDLGYDILCVPDHLGAAAPFPLLTAAAQATTTIRVSSYVLNCGFYQPALLSRDIAAVDMLSDGRLEMGLGTGYVRAEFEAAELPYPSAGRRVDHLERMATYLRARHPTVPLLIAGNGDRVLTLAARHADVIGLTGAKVGDVADPLAERVEFVRGAAGDRFASLELNLAITAVPAKGASIPDLSLTRRYAPEASDEELLAMPTVLSGSPPELADALSGYRERYGLTSFTVQDRHLENFATVIARLR
ncbi:TIGR03621 family F420-dependent LLM class oxidoreductase [Mycobacterium decipiens]|uniref:F420-dependent oxidoreductase n=1 Tax=Mycobacterium decipiens TaxID=1430326 RepID=A0A1X2LV20_9MYCO|nr:TIGR03621 family F420-dependent LLM class oxidoreductase [Mycobacterium decipiens]OSC40901.1 F420-dependent oxidoreductase [Mycobacterium decipiens]